MKKSILQVKPLPSCFASYLSGILTVLILAACSAPASTPGSMGSGVAITTTEAANSPAPIPATSVPTAMLTPTVTPSPTPELPPVLTAVPDAKLYVVNVNQGDEAPADLLEHLYLYNPGSGGGNFGEQGSSTVSWESAYAGAALPAMPQSLYFSGQGFDASPLPRAIFTLPNGALRGMEVSMSDGFTSFRYEIAPGVPLGAYSLTLEQGSKKLEDSFTLEMPAEPIQAQYKGNLWFMGFEPNEQVTLSLYYRDLASVFQEPEIAALFPYLPEFNPAMISDAFLIVAFLKQQIVTADEYGAFQAEVTSDQLSVQPYHGHSPVVAIARGELSGLAASYPSAEEAIGSCGDSQPLRLAIGSTARVTDYANWLEARTAAYRVVNLQPGSTMKVVWGPICDVYYSQWAWLVDTPDWTNLWVPESDANGYLLEPVNP